MLTIVAAVAWGKPVFLSHPDRREEANSARKLLAADSAGMSYLEVCHGVLCEVALKLAQADNLSYTPSGNQNHPGTICST